MIVPKLWSHAVILAKESVGVTTHFALQSRWSIEAVIAATRQADAKGEEESKYSSVQDVFAF